MVPDVALMDTEFGALTDADVGDILGAGPRWPPGGLLAQPPRGPGTSGWGWIGQKGWSVDNASACRACTAARTSRPGGRGGRAGRRVPDGLGRRPNLRATVPSCVGMAARCSYKSSCAVDVPMRMLHGQMGRRVWGSRDPRAG